MIQLEKLDLNASKKLIRWIFALNSEIVNQILKLVIDTTRVFYKHTFHKVEVYIKNQNFLLFGDEFMRLRYVPKLIVALVERIVEIKKYFSLPNKKIYQDLYNIPRQILT